MSEIDWLNIEEKVDVNPEESARLDSPSGKKCSCGKETTMGEDEAWGVCYKCYVPDGEVFKRG